MTWYTSLAGDIVNSLVKGFEEKYPFIKVEVFRGDQANVVQRITQEAQANKNIVDVIEVTSDGALLLKEMGLTVPYFSPGAVKLPETYRISADGNTVWQSIDRISYIGFSYNTSKLPPAAVPQTLNDLLKPELKDKLHIVSSTTGVRWVGAVLNQLGEEEGRKFLSQMSGQNVKVQSISGAALMELVAQGEAPASVSIFRNHNDQQKAKGASVEWLPIEPVIANAGGVIVAKEVKNPNASMLLIDFLLGSDGGGIFKKAQYSTPLDQISFKFWLPETNFETSKQYEQAYEQWKQIFNSTFK
ncbi:ABC transporter substrate-binding protein [Cohnella kolymensis]|uniref:ABC transporter substrate-binding protein n=1 Tax=Cohnella kolymensis TaxID=1590652 RepID=UPI000ADCF493|nr:extracellular solute-binding protein [Cohnella kolymensis]